MMLFWANDVPPVDKYEMQPFVKEHGDELLNENAIKKVYETILKLSDKDKVSKERMAIAIACYYISYIDENKEESFEEAFSMTDAQMASRFLIDSDFGEKMLSFVLSIGINYIKNYQTQDSKVMGLCEYVRHNFDLLYKLLIRLYPADLVPQMIIKILKGEVIIQGNMQVVEAVNYLKGNLELFTRVVYGDVYEDIKVRGYMQFDASIALRIINAALDADNFNLPENKLDAEYMIAYFGYICVLKQRRKNNRHNLLPEDKKVLKRINPMMELDF